MPKIKITETDKTGKIQSSQISNTVFVPIKKASGDSTARAEFMHVKSVTDLENYIGTTALDLYKNRVLSYNLCTYLLSSANLDLIVTVVNDAASINWTALKDKSLYDIRFITIGEFEGVSDAAATASARGDCVALYNLPLNFTYSLTDASTGSGGSNVTPAGGVATIADDENTEAGDPTLPETGDSSGETGDPESGESTEGGTGTGSDEGESGAGESGSGEGGTGSGESGSGTGDSGNGSGEANKDTPTGTTPTTIVGSIQAKFNSMVGSNGEYAACFAPNFWTTVTTLCIEEPKDTTVTKTNARNKRTTTTTTVTYEKNSKQQIPAAFGYLLAYANAIKNNPEWYAIAGFERGIIPELSDVLYDLSSAEMDALQCRAAVLGDEGDNVGAAINPIANIRPAGYIIYGNRTYRTNDAAKKTIAQSFLNIRNMLSAIKKKFYDASRKFTFEPNNELLWIRFQNYVTPYLEQLVNGNGLLGYKLVKVKPDAKARLHCRLVAIPIEAVEDFEIDVILVDDLSLVE